MTQDRHPKAAKHHDMAAPGSRDAASEHRQGDAAKAPEASTKAQAHSKKAHDAPGMTPSKTKDTATRR